MEARNLVTIIGLIICCHATNAQRQLDIRGNPSSTDTVVSIRVNYMGGSDVVGLKVFSNPSLGHGIAGDFTGGYSGVNCFGGVYGVVARSPNSGFGPQG
ncbi:MAG: hypothetical protein IPL46_04390 [Saprospiraceae bacterium]|nr:hypothetical protein [Saprospiraceae bacterium]